MDEDLFIDNLDMDWCFRVKCQGYFLYGICDVQMIYSIGEELLLLCMKLDGVIVYKFFCFYFIMCNCVLFYGCVYMFWVWIVQDVLCLLLKLVGNGLFFVFCWIWLWFMLRGLWDGF